MVGKRASTRAITGSATTATRRSARSTKSAPIATRRSAPSKAKRKKKVPKKAKSTVKIRKEDRRKPLGRRTDLSKSFERVATGTPGRVRLDDKRFVEMLDNLGLFEKVEQLDNDMDAEHFWKNQPPVVKGKKQVKTYTTVPYKKSYYLQKFKDENPVITANWTHNANGWKAPPREFVEKEYLMTEDNAAILISAFTNYNRPTIYMSEEFRKNLRETRNRYNKKKNRDLSNICTRTRCFEPGLSVPDMGPVTRRCEKCTQIAGIKAVLATHYNSPHCGLKSKPHDLMHIMKGGILRNDSVHKFASLFQGDHSTEDKDGNLPYNSKLIKMCNILDPTEFLQETELGKVQYVTPNMHVAKTIKEGDTSRGQKMNAPAADYQRRLASTINYRNNLDVDKLQKLTGFVHHEQFDFRKYLYWMLKIWEDQNSIVSPNRIDDQLEDSQIMELDPEDFLLSLFKESYTEAGTTLELSVAEELTNMASLLTQV